jgi:hypothetical protein
MSILDNCGIDCVYFVVVPALYPDRYKYLQNYVAEHKWTKVKFWQSITPNELPNDERKLYTYDDPRDNEIFRMKHSATTLQPCYENINHNIMNTHHVCLYHANDEIFRDAYKNNYDCIAILEDDVLFDIDFPIKFKDYMQQFLRSDGDILSIGDGCKLHANSNNFTQISANLWLNHKPHGRCTDSNIYKKNAIQKMHKYYESRQKRHHNIDWEYNWLFEQLGFKFIWAEPTIITQGSQLC